MAEPQPARHTDVGTLPVRRQYGDQAPGDEIIVRTVGGSRRKLEELVKSRSSHMALEAIERFARTEGQPQCIATDQARDEA
jgi:hypothetical protein